MNHDRYMEAMKALDRAIPAEEIERLRYDKPKIHNGNNYLNRHSSRGRGGVETRVCSFNNTRETRAEIIAWIEEAILLARHPESAGV